jgi:hypothetical protein
MKIYPFRREDDGSTVYVTFQEMMAKDAAGFITLSDGVSAREVREERHPVVREGTASAIGKPIISDALGFTEHQFTEMEAARQIGKFSGIEFVRDPQVPTFFQVKCSGPDEHRRYMEYRGMYDKNSRNGGGATMSQEQLDRAAAIVIGKYGPADA